MPSIAVIIPVGPGHAKLAFRAVVSAVKQTVKGIQPWAVNDTAGNGVGWARRKGTEWAAENGYDFVCYLDADDILMPRAIEMMLRALAANPGASYAYGDGYNLKDGAATYYRAAEYDRAIYGRQNIHNVTALMPTAVALAGEWTNKHWEDYLFYCSLAIKGHCGVRAPYPVIAYDLAAGYRRELAFGEGIEYALGLAAEYRQRFDKEATMGCCGNPGKVTLDAATMIEAVPGVATPAGKVRLAYTGTQLGPVPYNTNGRSYRGAAGREVFAHAEDVDFLIRTGRWYEVADVPSAEETVAYVAGLNAEIGLDIDVPSDVPAEPLPADVAAILDEPLPFTTDDEEFAINMAATTTEIAQVFGLPADAFDEGEHGSRGVAEAHAAQLFPPRRRGRKPGAK